MIIINILTSFSLLSFHLLLYLYNSLISNPHSAATRRTLCCLSPSPFHHRCALVLVWATFPLYTYISTPTHFRFFSASISGLLLPHRLSCPCMSLHHITAAIRPRIVNNNHIIYTILPWMAFPTSSSYSSYISIPQASSILLASTPRLQRPRE